MTYRLVLGSAAMPVNTRGRNRQPDWSVEAAADVERVRHIWSTASRTRSPWLFDEFCAADVMFAPVASRFQTYGIRMEGVAGLYKTALLAHPLVQEWFALGAAEADVIPQFELPERAA